MIITEHTNCSCGAVTLYFDNGQNNSIHQDNLDKFGIDLSESEELQETYCCNHCVNHYGLDLCGCGSGEAPEECEGGYSECGNPREIYGESVKFVGWA